MKKKVMKKQKTFEKASLAIEYLENLDYCFDIRKAKIIRVSNKTWRLYDWRLIVEYE